MAKKETEEVVEEVVKEVPKEGKENKAQPNKNILLGTISYQDEDDFEKFLSNIDLNQALFIIMSGCGYAQSRGTYSLEESELISKAVKVIKKQSKPDDNTK